MYPFDYMEVRPPPEVDLPLSGNKVLISAEAPMSFSGTRNEVIMDEDGSGFLIKIMKFVSRSSRAINAPADLKFRIEELRTPLSTKTSSSFKVYTKDQEGRVMNYIDTDFSTTMIRGK